MKVQGAKLDDDKSSSSIVRSDGGQLYDQQARELLEPLMGVEAMRRLEMFSAVHWLSRRMHDHVNTWAEQHGLSESRFQILTQLKYQDSVPLGRLAARLRVTPRAVTALIDQLERDGMVVRVNDPVDRRTVRAQLTDSGRALFDRIWAEYLQIPLALAGDLPQESLDLIRHTCLSLITKIDEADAAG